MSPYQEFIRGKARAYESTGNINPDRIHGRLFAWQKAVTKWALRKGRACIFADCGLGKTLIQLEWARHIPGDVLILAPLAVSRQTEREAQAFGWDAKVSNSGERAAQTTITNYEKLHLFDLSEFAGVVLDESSILKAHTGKTRTALIEGSRVVPYRLACTATPAPNDHMELGNHAEFVGAMTRAEMLSTYFVHDGGDTSKWRLKGHARAEFWAWVASWAVMVRTPSDIGFDGDGYDLPALNTHEHIVESGHRGDGELFATAAISLHDQRRARRETLPIRVDEVAVLVNSTPGPWVVWCEFNAEGDALTAAIDGAVQVAGADSDEAKTEKLSGFSAGDYRVIVSKPKIAGFGLNWQHCNQQAFVGLSHSWEQFYQAVRRSWRFGQENEVDIHIIATDRESAVLDNIKRKQDSADEMATEMVALMSDTMKLEVKGVAPRVAAPYEESTETGEDWTMHHGDCVDAVSRMASESIDYSIFSPPFSSLYTYSASDRDMGNCTGDAEFHEHFGYLVRELSRVTKPGRLLSFHCMMLPMSKARDGVIGLRDFRGDLLRAFTAEGWIFHSEVTIWKDPVTAMQRTKALGLLHKQIKKDSCMSRQGIADYLVTVRKPGINPEPVSHTAEGFPVSLWQRYASPVWMDINPSDTLQYRSAREHDDERHICPLQLGVIRRALKLWSNPGDLVLSPFAGIGSEGHVALESMRRFVGVELKDSYFKQACRNLRSARAQLSFL
tara:strand:- start:47 stop:2230 length:2184 start_codon:yes stop_codon:yes gene_type:complete